MAGRADSGPRKPPARKLTRSGERSRLRASWILTAVLGVFFIAVFAWAPTTLPPFKQHMLGFAAALLAGTCAIFWTGSLAIHVQWLTARFGQIAVRGGGGLAVFVLVLLWWESPLAPVRVDTGVYRVRATVLSPDGNPAEDAKVVSSLGGEIKKVAGGWEIDIPGARPGASRRLMIHATEPTAFLQGSAEIDLGEDREPSVSIRLQADRSAKVRGSVIDAEGRALAGVRVSVAGHEAEGVVTGPDGGFVLAAGAATGQQVQLSAEKTGFEPRRQYHPAGDAPAVLRLERTERK
jgi:hypothetical protein